MQSKLQFYHFQNEILEKFESEIDRGDKKIHIVAPPGSGKTIVWIEMINRLIKKWVPWNVLILVPNIILQAQWKDKISDFFLEASEDIEMLVSTSRDIVKKINILTYQSMTQAEVDTDDFLIQILDHWYKDVKKEFKDYEDFLNYTETLKETDIKEYLENISKFKKKVKLTNSWDVLSSDVTNYLNQLKQEKISSIIVDEAHHLTNFRSKALYHIWQFLDKPFIVWLTATPPFENSDFFILNDDYTALLWEVDYYVPTPAIVKAGRLAPYNDLVYFVEPGDSIKEMMRKNDMILNEFIENNKIKIWEYLSKYIKENYDKLLKNSQDLLLNYIKFLYNYWDKKLVSDYVFTDLVFEKITLDDVAKSVWKYIWNIKWEKIVDEDNIKNMFYNMGYIWRINNFYRFRTPVEMALIYSKSKINWVRDILKKEIENKWKELKMAIITDFLDESENDYINAKYILDEINKSNPELKTILVSGQWIWQYENNLLKELQTDILEVTKKLEDWEINLVIWTRWILWEWWDCPKLNTLIDLTWVSAYMSVNQIRWRAIRLDQDNPKKVANIYDVICITDWYKWLIDYERVSKKYENFYWVDASWLVVKWINHIYPDLVHHLWKVNKINENMLNRSNLLEYFYELWGIGGGYENKEVFWLNLEIDINNLYFPFVKTKLTEFFKFNNLFKIKKTEKIEDIWKNNFYYILVKRFIKTLLDSLLKTLIKFGDLPDWFNYELKDSQDWNIKIVSNYKDALVWKTFINHINDIFSQVSTQRYMLDIFSFKKVWNELKEDRLFLSLPNIVAKNEAYRDEIENNMADSFLKIIYWKLVLLYKKSLLNVYKFQKKLQNVKYLKILLIIFSLIIFLFILFNLFEYYSINFDYLAIVLFSLIVLLILFPFWVLFLLIIIGIYLHLFDFIKIIYYFIIAFWLIILVALLEKYKIINSGNFLVSILFYIYYIIVLFIFMITNTQLYKKSSFLSFIYTNKKLIKIDNKTKSWINSDYIRFLYLNSPLVKKDEYVWKKPFISWKIEKLWI